MLDQDNNFYLIHLSTLILLDSGWILWGEVTCKSPLGVEGLNEWGKEGRCVWGGGWGGVIRDCGKWFVDNTGQKVPLFKGKMLTV